MVQELRRGLALRHRRCCGEFRWRSHGELAQLSLPLTTHSHSYPHSLLPAPLHSLLPNERTLWTTFQRSPSFDCHWSQSQIINGIAQLATHQKEHGSVQLLHHPTLLITPPYHPAPALELHRRVRPLPLVERSQTDLAASSPRTGP